MLFGGGITLSLVLKDSGASKIMADGIISLIAGGHLFLIGLLVSLFIVFLTEFYLKYRFCRSFSAAFHLYGRVLRSATSWFSTHHRHRSKLCFYVACRNSAKRYSLWHGLH